MAAPQHDDAPPEDSGVVPELAKQDAGDISKSLAAPAPIAPAYQTQKLSDTISNDLVRNPASRLLLMFGVESIERNADRLSKEVDAVRAELENARETIAEFRVKLALAEHDIASARRDQTAASVLITIGVLLVGAAVELRGERVIVWALVGLVGAAMSLYGWLGFRPNRGGK